MLYFSCGVLLHLSLHSLAVLYPTLLFGVVSIVPALYDDTKGYSPMHLTHKAGLALALLVAAGLAAYCPASAQTLTGSILFSADANGNISADNIWTTNQSSGGIYKLWTYKGTTTTLVNASTTDSTLNFALTPGTYTFGIYGSQGASTGFQGLNLFFDGQAATPGISVKANTLTSLADTSNFSANGGTTTLDYNDNFVPGANTLSFVDGATTIQLTAFFWATPDVNNMDRVSPFTATPDQQTDFVGSYTLKVSQPVPEASSVVSLGLLLLLGAGGVAVSRRRRVSAAG